MNRALEFAPYFEAHAVAALTAANERPGMKDARQLVRWIREERLEGFTKREAYKANFGRDKSLAAERTDDACEILETHNLIRKGPAPRVDSVVYEVHPDIHRLYEVSDLSYVQDKLVSDPSHLTNGSVEPNDQKLDSRPTHSESRTLQTLEDEREPRFEEMPDTELDRFLPVSARETQHFERKAPGAPASLEAIEVHDALIPEVAEHHLAEPVDWDASLEDGAP